MQSKPEGENKGREDVVLEIIGEASEGGEDHGELDDDLEGRDHQRSRSTKGIITYGGDKKREASSVETAASHLVGNNTTSRTGPSSVREEGSEEYYDGGTTVVSPTPLRRGEHLFPIAAPGAVSIFPDGVTPWNDQFYEDDEEEDQTGQNRDASNVAQSLHVPEATAVPESALVHAVRQSDLEDMDASTSRGCSRRTMLIGGLLLLFVVGVIVTTIIVAITVAGGNNQSSTFSPSTPPSMTPSTSLRPSSSPSNSFKTVLVELIQSRSPKTKFSPSSAAASAITWMVNDTYTLSLENNDDRLVQRFALVYLWFAFGLKPSSKPELEGWMQPTDECIWRGPGLANSLTPGCNENGVVEALDLHEANASGSIPIEIFLLSHLKDLELVHNSLTGTIPRQLSLLTSLTSLRLGHNIFTGTFPSELWSSLTNLELLNLRDIPTMSPSTISARMSALTKLSSLTVARIQLSGTIPTELGSMTALTWLDTTGLSGSLPTHIGMLSRLGDMNFHGNQMTGPIPTEIGLLTLLTNILLAGNYFTGTIPTKVGLLTRLSELNFSNCRLNGTIPTEIGHIRNLQFLKIGSNPLMSGTIPSQIYSLSRLKILSIGGRGGTTMMSNSLIMTEIGLLTNLESLSLSGSNFIGTIPSTIASLSQLLELSLGSNQLTGTIPSELAQLTRLTYLGLDQNSVAGSIPNELSLLTDLVGLDLSLNHGLVGTLMTEIGLLVRLENLLLGWNDLTGTLPTELVSLTSLTSLWLNHNQFSGSLPSELASLPLSGLYLDTNELLTGTIPDSICATATHITVDYTNIVCSCC